LVVDDDVDTVGFLKVILQHQGYEILTAQDGHEVLDLLQTQSVDLILTDVAMPHLNGYELCQRVKNAADPHIVLTPVILMSGRTLDSDIRYAKSLGADDYLPKPLDVDDLLAVVQGKLLAAERVQNLIKRETNGAEVITLIINQQQVRLDYRQHRVWVEDQEVELTAREVFLLERLARQPNEIISLVEMVKATHDLETDSQEAGQLLRPLIRTLRRKLEVHLGTVPCIKNVRSRGYLLTSDPRVLRVESNPTNPTASNTYE
ncbi:MAG: response regulator transcription factor, partial [Anaerolineae bacterium]|nr:response regulator transcription factor [Anaerolineae bacterium]